MEIAKVFVLVEKIAENLLATTGSTNETSKNNDLKFDFPINTQLSLIDLENQLIINTLFQRKTVSFGRNSYLFFLQISKIAFVLIFYSQVCAWSRFGGKNAKKTAQTIAEYIISDGVYIAYSWAGTKTKMKYCIFKGILDTILAAIHTHYDNFTMAELIKVIQEHLKHTKNRLERKSSKQSAQ